MADILRRIVEICEFLQLPESDTAKRLLFGVNDESLPDGHRKQMKQLLERIKALPNATRLLQKCLKRRPSIPPRRSTCVRCWWT